MPDRTRRRYKRSAYYGAELDEANGEVRTDVRVDSLMPRLHLIIAAPPSSWVATSQVVSLLPSKRHYSLYPYVHPIDC